MTDASFPLRPVPIHVPDDVLEDLTARLKATRWPQDAGNEDGYYGLRRAYLQELAEYWIDGYDWRAAEAAINAYQHYKVDVGGVPVHFMRKPGVGPDPTPLVLSHGWPWTFWHWSKVIDPLADPGAFGADPAEAFDVIRAVDIGCGEGRDAVLFAENGLETLAVDVSPNGLEKAPAWPAKGT